MKLDKFTKKKLLGAVAVLAAAVVVVAVVLLAHELQRAWTLRELQAENDAKQYAGSQSEAGSDGAEILVPWGWGNDGDPRPDYTLDEVNAGALGEEIVFNSISDSVIGHEKNFVGAREYTGADVGTENVWNGNLLTVEDGKEYLIRAYVHNDNPNGAESVSTGTRVAFSISDKSAVQVPINGYIFSDNSKYSTYWDSVVLQAEQPFHLEYVAGSAMLENNGIGADGGCALSDDIVYKAASEHGVAIGYEELDGRVPGCYQYAAYVSIRVRVVFD